MARQGLLTGVATAAVSLSTIVRLEQLVDQCAKKVIEMALLHAAWNQAMPATLLDLSPSSLLRKATRHGILHPASDREMSNMDRANKLTLATDETDRW